MNETLTSQMNASGALSFLVPTRIKIDTDEERMMVAARLGEIVQWCFSAKHVIRISLFWRINVSSVA